MRNILFFVMLIIPLCAISQERQIPLDADGKINIIDAPLEKKLSLFNDYRGFTEARLYQANDTTYVLEVSYMPERQMLRERKQLSPGEVSAFRSTVTEKLAQKAPYSILDQSGRTGLLVASTVVGTLYYGTAISTIISPNYLPSYTGIYLLTAGMSFYLPYAVTRKMEVTRGQSTMATYGLTRGIAHGMLLPVVFSSDVDYKVALTLGVSGSIAEGILGYQWAKKHHFSEGRAGAIGTFSDFGMGIALATAHLAGLFDGNVAGNMAALSVLTGAGAGLYAGYRLTQNENYSTGDVIALQGAGLLGAYLPPSLLFVAGVDEPKLMTLATALGGIGGLYLGDKLALKQEFSTRQGVFISLSQVAGALTGMGCGYLLGGKNDDYYYNDRQAKLVTILTGIGATAGYLAAVRNFSKEINKEDKNLTMRLQLNPLGLLNLSQNKPANIGNPVFMGSIRF